MVDTATRATERDRVKRVATGLLVAMTVVFVVATIVERDHGWATLVRVTAEASMVGALADWFAVTALFRHPLGIPIPHTAIIPRRKNQIGRALGGFIQTSFLTKQNVTERVRNAGLAARLGVWLDEPGNVTQAARQVTEGLAAIVVSLDDEQLAPALRDVAIERIRGLELASLASLVVAGATAKGRHQDLVDGLLPVIDRAIDANREALMVAVERSSPRWVPRAVDQHLLDRAIVGAHQFIADVAADRSHPFRTHVDTLAAELVERLRTDPGLATKADELKEELLASPAVQHYLDGLWEGAKDSIVDQAGDPTSALRRRVETSIAGFGEALRGDPDLQHRLDVWAERIVGELADRFQGQISELVMSTVERWDAAETAQKLEELIGRDLQFIRINGTVVGGLAGLTIYLVSRLFA